MMRNLTSPRARWRKGNAMAAHDGLPPPLRAWATQAALPWSPASLHKLWLRALRETGCTKAALARLSAAEAASLRREAAQVWGRDYPA
ncbi:DUF6525 family protein [Pseudotabrizicola algicola]|uniref:Uncharacterized protein n=1 Tax=Pseudotabrizicola algicola TaxID=2709381 RepID=A0A6B3RMZ4_9RHOB|nr:DUF6525 family protein [Pseudotabrizicola algicola]NEX46811.1 hypothetical protein [Pseudotabrizicola algicola]